MIYKRTIYLFFSFLFCFASPLCGLPYEVAADRALDSIAERLAKQNGLKYLMCGMGGLIDSDKITWALSFTDDRQMTIEQARPMAVLLAKRLLAGMRNHMAFDIYLREVAKDKVHAETNLKELSQKCLGFKIAYWDKQCNRPPEPYVSQVRVVGKKIYYYYADPKDHSLRLVLKETLDNASAQE